MRIPSSYRLRSHRGRFGDEPERKAYEAMMHDVLGLSPEPMTDHSWAPIALFDPDGCCVAGLETGLLAIIADGSAIPSGGIRSVAVAPTWRGRGLFRALMDEALAWCDRQHLSLVLLYTEEPALYERFGFASVAQHAFLGPAPPPAAHTADTSPRLVSTSDAALLVPRLAQRTPVSLNAALLAAPALFLSNLANDGAPALAFAPSIDAAVAFEEDGDTLVIADIVSPRIPRMPVLLGALRKTPTRIKTLFSPDRLGWQGAPVREDTGLMARGSIPAAMTRPFMFPPTAEF